MDKYSPAIVLATVQHTGSHFALNLLAQYYHRHSMGEDRRRDTDVSKPPFWFAHCEPEGVISINLRMQESELLVLTMRHPMDVARSWIKRNKPMTGRFRAMWRNLFALQEQHKGLWLPIDTPDRDMRLQAISERLGIELTTDWAPKGVTGDVFTYREGMTLAEVRGFYQTLPFAQFYGDMKMVKKVAKKVAKKGRSGTKLRAFVFTGDPRDSHNPTWIHMCGYSFKLNGAAIKVSNAASAKLANNTHFTEK